MAWIEVHQKLISDSKIIDMSAELRVEQKHVIGMMVTFWLWAIDNAGRDGDLSKFSAYTIAAASGWLEYVQHCRSNQRLDKDQVPDVSEFCHALVTVSFINVSVNVPDDDFAPLGNAYINAWEKYTNRYFDYFEDV